MKPGPIISPWDEQEQYELITDVARTHPRRTLGELIFTRCEFLDMADEDYRERYGKYGRLEKAYFDGIRLAKIDELNAPESLEEF